MNIQQILNPYNIHIQPYTNKRTRSDTPLNEKDYGTCGPDNKRPKTDDTRLAALISQLNIIPFSSPELCAKVKEIDPKISTTTIHSICNTCATAVGILKTTPAETSPNILELNDLRAQVYKRKDTNLPYNLFINHKTHSFFMTHIKKPHEKGTVKTFRPGIVGTLTSSGETKISKIAILVTPFPPSLPTNPFRLTQSISERGILFEMRDTPGISKLQGWEEYQGSKKGEVLMKHILLMDLYGPDFDRLTKLKPKHYLTNEQKLKIILDVMRSVKALHERGILHCDLKLENILTLITNENNQKSYEAYLTDFGHSYKPKENNHYGFGTPSYWTPETVDAFFKSENPHFPNPQEKDDAWALGCIAYSIFYDCNPIWFDVLQDLSETKFSSDQSKFQTLYSTFNQMMKNWSSNLQNISEKNFIYKMLNPNLKERIPFSEAFKLVEQLAVKQNVF